MKKLFAVVAMMGLSVSAVMASDITGLIGNVDNTQKTITVNGNVIKVMPYTKIEQDACGAGWDIPKQFADLKNGLLVEVDVEYQNNVLIAEDIEIKCQQNRAY